jgi:hypothetical protein
MKCAKSIGAECLVIDRPMIAVRAPANATITSRMGFIRAALAFLPMSSLGQFWGGFRLHKSPMSILILLATLAVVSPRGRDRI